MTTRQLKVEVPRELYEWLREAAEISHRTVDTTDRTARDLLGTQCHQSFSCDLLWC